MKIILHILLVILITIPTITFAKDSFDDNINSEFEDFKQSINGNTDKKVTTPIVIPSKKHTPIEDDNDLISGNVDEATKYGLVEFIVQAGAFKKLDTAVKFVEKLNKQDLDAFYFYDSDHLFKVRFGNFASRDTAERIALDLKQNGIINDYQIVSPSTYSYTKIKTKGTSYVRDKLVTTVKRHLGIRYLWGGTSAKTGFDCSGLMMITYKMNGLVIPRNSRVQFQKGNRISKSRLQKGDLVFFATGSNRKRISHVGLYIGNGKFVHAPGKGKRIRIASLNNSYFLKRYIGAVSYI